MATSAQKAAITRRANREAKERMARIEAQIVDDAKAINHAIAIGVELILNTGFGPYVVDHVTSRMDYITHAKGSTRDYLNQRTFMGCNDGTWRDLVGKARGAIEAREG